MSYDVKVQELLFIKFRFSSSNWGFICGRSKQLFDAPSVELNHCATLILYECTYYFIWP